MSKIDSQEPQRNRNGTANFVNLIRTSTVTLSPPYKLSSAKLLVCFNFQSASMLSKVGENLV